MMTFIIRKATCADLDVLADFSVDMAHESEQMNLDRETVKAGIALVLKKASLLGSYWVIEQPVNTKLVGTALLTIEWSDWHNQAYGWLQSVYILPEHRGHGLLQQLITTIEHETRVENKPLFELRLYVDEQNQRAISAYVREGFSLSSYLVMRKTPAEV